MYLINNYVDKFQRKSIENDINEQDEDGDKEMDFTEMREFDELFFAFRGFLERSVLLLMEIWLQLAEEKPGFHHNKKSL